ncbi:MAG: helix-turn-helix domain-containing protein [Syntrophobacteraceae bacterium]
MTLRVRACGKLKPCQVAIFANSKPRGAPVKGLAAPAYKKSSARAAALARGERMGRKRLLSAQQVAHARKLIEQGEGPDNVAQSLNVSRRTLYRALAASPC